jgi:CheY-like chemotaxis protein
MTMSCHALSERPLLDVLVVEDDPDLGELFVDTLTAYGLGVVAVPDAPEAMEYLEHNPTPRVLIVDLMLPSMTGTDLLRQLRQSPHLETVPAFLATAAMVSSDAELDGLGVVRVLRKPFDVQLVVGMLREICGSVVPPAG